MTLPVTDILHTIARDPDVSPEYRAAARGALARLDQACDVAVRWGGDEGADLRMGIFKRAALAGPGEFAEERIALSLALDELCRAMGVPLDGPVKGVQC